MVDNKDMEDTTLFTNELEAVVTLKQNWFNQERLQELLENYRLLFTCVKNLNEILVKKSIIVSDPYKYDKKITGITPIDTSPFSESDYTKVLGIRLSDYEMMLDFICTYFRFSVESITIQKIKAMQEFNKCIEWDNLVTNSGSIVTRVLLSALTAAKVNAQGVTVSLINDSVEKSASSIKVINLILTELADFQREVYKLTLRKDLFEHPEFNKEKAFASAESEMAEIRRLYARVMEKKPFYTDLVQEIINEDQAENKDLLRKNLLGKLLIPTKTKTVVKKAEINPNEILNNAVLQLGSLAPILQSLHLKISENFELLFYQKKGFFAKLAESLRKALGIKEKEKICNISIVDQRTGGITVERIIVGDFLRNLERRYRIYAGIAAKGSEYNKIIKSPTDTILNYLNKQIGENQSLHTLIAAIDEHFKSHVESFLKIKVKGLKIDLSSYRNSIININKKRGEYVSYFEEIDQMRKLGIKNE